MKIVSSLFLFLLLVSCQQQEEKKEESHLDLVAHKIQRCAFWQREYYWELLKWRDKNNADSIAFYEHKMDSTVTEYKFQNRLYFTLVDLYEKRAKSK